MKRGKWVKYALWLPWLTAIVLLALKVGGIKRLDPLFITNHGVIPERSGELYRLLYRTRLDRGPGLDGWQTFLLPSRLLDVPVYGGRQQATRLAASSRLTSGGGQRKMRQMPALQ